MQGYLSNIMTAADAPHREPEEVFLPLSDRRYAEFYTIEMTQHTEDIQFYLKHSAKGEQILELGCGTGRIARALSNDHRTLLGLDLSFSMLQQLSQTPHNPLACVCMDMTTMAFRKKFDRILIPHNTLNLLRDNQLISRCLQQSAALLKPAGSLLLQLHIPNKELIAAGNKKIFQFKVLKLSNPQGKLIKETLLSFCKTTQEILLEERYRLRRPGRHCQRKDFKKTLRLAGFSLEQWLEILKTNGFSRLSVYGGDTTSPYQNGIDSKVFILARPAAKEKNKEKR